jgi:transposase
MRPKGTPEELEARRRRAMTLLKDGVGVDEIAKQIGTTPWSIYRWRQIVEKKGKSALKAQPHPHRPCRLSPKQKANLLELLLQGATAFGYQNQLWTLPRIAKLIEKHFGITYHPASVWRILHSLGWSCQKPQRYPRGRKEEEIQLWRKEKWPHIKKLQKRRQDYYLH